MATDTRVKAGKPADLNESGRMPRHRETIALCLIDDNPWQPRQSMDLEALEELANSILHLGMLQVPLVRFVGDGRYQLAFGHRRVAACRMLHERGQLGPEIEIDVAGISDEEMAVIALTENQQRKDLTQIELLRAHKKAVDETELTIQELATRLGIDRSTMSNNLRVLELPDVVLKYVESGDMSITAAREFLVLQCAGHAHTDDMNSVIHHIGGHFGRRGTPDWSRRHVRERVYLAVAYNEKDWRPLESKPVGHAVGGAHQEPNFDVDAFKAEYPNSLHTIPAVSKREVVNWEEMLICDGSRLWTCEVKAWSLWKGRATREANRSTEASGNAPPAAKKAKDKDSQLGELLAKDPVWKAIAAGREKKGPHRPVTDEEREQLGSRAELKQVSSYGGGGFYKLLQRAGNSDSVHRWNSENGGPVPPFFPDLKDCHSCTGGASYVRITGYGGYSSDRNNKPQLACFNRTCYGRKLEAGAAEYREQMVEVKQRVFGEDREAAQGFLLGLESISDEALRALAITIVTQTKRLELQHPFGEHADGWSYEARSTVRVREILAEHKDKTAHQMDQAELRELVANLMVHHLRLSGELDAFPRETPVAAAAAAD